MAVYEMSQAEMNEFADLQKWVMKQGGSLVLFISFYSFRERYKALKSHVYSVMSYPYGIV